MPKSVKINGPIFPHANRQLVFFPENIGEEQKKVFTSADVLISSENIGEEPKRGLYTLKCPTRKKLKGHMLVSETSAAALPLTGFRDLARVPSSARMPGVAHPWPTT